MNPYLMLGSGLSTHEAASLGARLSAWHDAMVAHERRLRTDSARDACDEECPHAEAPVLWSEAIALFGTRAHELRFLRARAAASRREAAAGAATGATLAKAADSGRAAARRGGGPAVEVES